MFEWYLRIAIDRSQLGVVCVFDGDDDDAVDCWRRLWWWWLYPMHRLEWKITAATTTTMVTIVKLRGEERRGTVNER